MYSGCEGHDLHPHGPKYSQALAFNNHAQYTCTSCHTNLPTVSPLDQSFVTKAGENSRGPQKKTLWGGGERWVKVKYTCSFCFNTI